MAQTQIKQEYVHPEVLVDTQWIEDHPKDDKGTSCKSCRWHL